MKVHELISYLQNCTQDAEVVTGDSEYDGLFRITVSKTKIYETKDRDKYIGPYDDNLDDYVEKARAESPILDAVIIEKEG